MAAKPNNPPPSVEEGKELVVKERNIADNYGGVGSQGQGPLPAENGRGKSPTLEQKAKASLNNIGGMFKKGWGFVAKGTVETAGKISQSGFGQSVKTNFSKAAEVTKTGVIAGFEKTKEFGGKVADKSVALGHVVKEGVKTGFVGFA